MSIKQVDFNAGPNKSDGTTYISNPDVPIEGVDVTICGLKKEMVKSRQNDKPPVEHWVAYFDDIRCGVVLGSKEVRRFFSQIGSEKGKKLIMYRDMKVKSPQGMGGIRFKTIKEEKA